MKKNEKKFALIISVCMLLAGACIVFFYQAKVWNMRMLQVANAKDILQETQSSEQKGKTNIKQKSETKQEGKVLEEGMNSVQKTEEADAKEDPKAKVLEQYYDLGVVKGDVSYLNIREMPTKDSLIIGKMPRYCGMNILSKTSDWYYVQSGDIVGYVSAESVVTGEKAEELAVEQCRQMLQVIPETLDVYKEPSINSEVWTKLNRNERYIIKKKVNNWYLLDFNSEDAYVSANDVIIGYYLPQAEGWTSITDCSEERQELIEYGMQYLGVPYVWGGTDFSTGVDCSGFTLLCYAHIGIILPRTSYTQVEEGKEVSLEDAKPGDLMFYTNAEGTVNHVAIYIGDGKILQSANSLHQVTISAYNYNTEPYMIKNIIGD